MYQVTLNKETEWKAGRPQHQTHRSLIGCPAGTIPNAEVTYSAPVQGLSRYLYSLWYLQAGTGSLSTPCDRVRALRDLQTGRHTFTGAMAPLSVPLSSLLKHRDCLQRVNVFCNAAQGLRQRPLRSRSWKRNFGQLLTSLNRPQNYAASVCRSFSSGPDAAERLWSIYNETKRQTEGTDSDKTLNRPLR